MSSDARTLRLRDGLGDLRPVPGQHAVAGRELPADRAQAKARRETRIAASALVLLVLGSLFLVVAAANRPSLFSATTHTGFFPGWMAGPLGGLLPWMTRSSSALRYMFTGTIALMYVAYLFAFAYAPRRLPTRWTIAAVVCANLVFFLAPPMALTDVFNYINYGRMEIVHHLNPYTTYPVLEPHSDPSYALSNWHELLSPYGPLFTLLTFALVPLGVAASFWTIKAILIATSLGTILLVWKCAKLLDRDPVRAIVLVGLNPIVLVWGLGGDHNDFLMVFFMMLGFYLLLRGGAFARPAAPAQPGDAVCTQPGATGMQPGAPAQPCAAGMQPGNVASMVAGTNGRGPPAGVPASGPQAGVHAAAAQPSAPWGRPARRSWRRTIGSWLWPLTAAEVGAGAAFVTATALKASGGILIPIVAVALLRTPRRLTQVLIGVLAAGVVIAIASVIAFGAHIPDLSTQSELVTETSIPNLIGLALGNGGETETLHTVLTVVLALSLVGCCALAWRRREAITPTAWVTVALLVTLGWVLPWYVLWLLPLAALSRSRRLVNTALVLGAYLIIVWAPASGLLWHAIGFEPGKTTLGRLHQRYVRELLY
jgi:hypothetical protein